MELRHLRYFVAVAEELHFGRAAERLHIAQPPLSRQIRDLERELGTPLFERGRRGVELTPAGRAFLPEARLTLAQAERAQRTAQRAAGGEIGRIRVGFSEAATYSEILPDVLAFFRMHLPNIGISLFEMEPLQQAEALRDGRIDLGILQSPPPDADRWLRVDVVYASPLVAALPRGHPLADRTRLSLADLADEPFVLWGRGGAPRFYDTLIDACARAGFEPRIVYRARGVDARLSYIAAGLGVGLEAETYAVVQRPGLVFVPLRSAPAAVLQLARSERPLSAAAARVANALGG